MTSLPHNESGFSRFSLQNLPPIVSEHSSRRSLSEGELLFQEGDPASAIYFLESGSIRLLNYTRSGKTVEQYSVAAGEFFAEVLMLMTVCTCTAIAEKVSQVLVIPKSVWIEALQTHHDLSLAYVGELTHRLYQLKAILHLRGIRLAKERVWQYLKIMANPQTKILQLDRPLKVLARELDLTPETLSRVLGQLTRENLIRRDAKTIRLLD